MKLNKMFANTRTDNDEITAEIKTQEKILKKR